MDRTKQGTGGRIRPNNPFMNEVEQLEQLLAEACKKLAQRQAQTIRVPPPLADCSPELRDWYGKYRHLEKFPAGKECFDS